MLTGEMGEVFLRSLFAFLLGGGLCVITQILIDKTNLSSAKILVGFVVFGVLLGALNVYEWLLDNFGCGITLPLCGFGGAVAVGVREAVSELGALGIIKGAFVASAAGCTAALLMGFLMSLFFKAKPKRL